jgi:HD superfamily phosphohydrolase
VTQVHKLREFLDPGNCKAIRDPIWHHVHLPESFARLLPDRAFGKLQGIRQLGPAHLVYPGATHTRFNHSLGVFHVAKRFLERLMADPGGAPLVSAEGGQAFLAAALMHDLGHFPYTHSLKELPLKDHEELTAELVATGSLAEGLDREGVRPGDVAAIVDHGIACTEPELLLYRSVLSGVLDPDKLDYLNRDAYFCGVPYGTQDLDFILENLMVHEGRRVGIRQAGLSSIEHVLFSKYLMYRAVYWHRQVRTATAMIKQALHRALAGAAIQPGELYHLDDNRFITLALSRASREPALELVRQVQERQLLPTVLEVPFRDDPDGMGRLSGLDGRLRAAGLLAAQLSAGRSREIRDWEVVIDIPESISFESDMPVATPSGPVPYLSAGTVFTAGVVRDFTASLRVLRVMAPVDPDNLDDCDRTALLDCLEEGGDA